MSGKATIPAPEPAFVSQQVTEARRYYLDLRPQRKAGLAVVCGGVERMRADYVVRRKDFPYYAMELVVEGEGTLDLNGKRHDLEAGVVFAYGPGVPHTIRSDPRRRMRKYYLDFAGGEAAGLLQAAGLGDWKARRVTALAELVEIFEALEREARDDSPLSRALCETLARLLLLKVQQRVAPGGASVPRSFTVYEKVRQHAEQHWMRLRTVEDLARECHVSAMQVSRLFRRFARTGAYQFLLRLKMNHAAELLEGGLLVKEAAARLGFADQFQFSRAFKRVYGVAPMRILAGRSSSRL